MGFAILEALVKKFDVSNLYISDTSEEKIKSAIKNLKIPKNNCFLDFNDLLKQIDIVILAIKPQAFEEFTKFIKIDLKDKVVISIMAGVSIEKINKFLKIKKIIRSMPNLCAQVSQALTGWISSKEVSKTEKEIAKKIFRSFGEEIELKKEDKINELTALSGSGPAYFFYLTELLEEKANFFGFTEEEARKIAEITFIGSAKVLEKSRNLPSAPLTSMDLKNAVTSKGGTTEAALKFMEENKFGEIFQNAVECAKRRAEEMNGK